MKELTARQQQILRYLHSHFYEAGYWPSIRDIQSYFDFKSTNAVMGHLKALERKGAITRVPGQARAYKLSEMEEPSVTPDEAMDVVSLPVYGSIAAGYPDGVESPGEIGRIQVDTATANVGRNPKAFALKVNGLSMMDAGILDGDIVILEPAHPRNNDIVAALIDNETTLKRYIEPPRRKPYLKAENPDYPELYPATELVIQGVARAVVRSL